MTAADESRVVWRHEPTTTSGLGLRGALRKTRTMPDDEVDWSAWIAAIEAEAALAARSEPRAEGLREALAALVADVQRVLALDPGDRGGEWNTALAALDGSVDVAGATLAATPPAEGLDVERLHDEWHPHCNGRCEIMRFLRDTALAPEHPERAATPPAEGRATDGLAPLISTILRKYGGTMKGRGDHDIFDALVRYRAALAPEQPE